MCLKLELGWLVWSTVTTEILISGGAERISGGVAVYNIRSIARIE